MKEKLAFVSNYCIDKLIVFLLLFVPVFYVFGKGEHYFFSIYDIFKEVSIQSIAVVLLGFYIIKIYAEDDIHVKHSPLLWPLACFFGVILLSLLEVYNIYEGLIFVLRWGCNFIILFVVYNYVNEKKYIRRYLNYLVLIGFGVSLYGILQIWHIDFGFLHQNFTGNSTFGNPNFASEYILILFPLAFLLIFADIHMGWFFYYVVCAATMFIYLILNKSRAVWIGGGLAGILLSIYLVIHFFKGDIRYHGGPKEKAHALFIFRSFIVGIILFALLIGISFLPFTQNIKPLKHLHRITQQVVTEFQTLENIKLAKGEIVRGDTATQRLLIWKNTLRMIKNNSVLGVGIGNFKIQYQPYRTKEEQLSTGPDIFVRRAHNEHIQLLAELGPFGIVFFYWMIGVSLWMCVQIIKKSRTLYGQCLGIGFALSILSTYIAIFFNFSLQTPTPAMTLYFVTGIMMSSYDFFLKKEETSKSLTQFVKNIKISLRGGLFVLVIILFILPFWLVRPAIAYYYYQFGQACEKMGLRPEARLKLEKSLRYFPYSWEAHFVLANVQAALGDVLAAKKGHEYSLKLNPYHQKGHYNLANTLYKLGETDEAIAHYKEAMRIDSIFYQSYNNLGSIYFKKKDYEEAVKYFKIVTELEPNYFSGQYNLAYILYLLHRYKEALPYAETAISLNPKDGKARRLLGELLQKSSSQG